VLGLYAVQESVRVLAAAGVDALRAKSVELTELLIEAADAELAPLGFEVATPRAAERRGGHVALAHPDAYRIGPALRARARVIPDVRPPDRLRLAPVPAYTRFVDVLDAVERIAALAGTGG
jgi:kynureninase